MSARDRALRTSTFTLVASLLLPSLGRSALGAAFYVAPSGDDAHAGTLAAPFATVAHGLSAVQPGDTLWIEPGTYAVTATLFVSQVASQGAPITVSGVLGSPRPVIDASGITSTTSGQNDGIGVSSAGFIVLRHLAITGAPRHGVTIWASHDVSVLDCEISSSKFNAVYGGGTIRNVRVSGCWAHDNDLANPPGTDATGGWGQGIGLSSIANGVVEGNLIERTFGEGIDIYEEATACEVDANTVLDSFSVSIYLDHADTTTLERNFVRTTDPTYYRGGAPASGVQVADEQGSGPSNETNQNDVVQNNVAIGTSAGFEYGNYGWPAGLHGAQVLHNTFVRTTLSVMIDPANATYGANTGDVFAGNAFLDPASAETYIPGGLSGIDFHDNAWFGGTGAVAGPGDVTAEPMLVNLAGTSPFDMEPTASSPLVHAATGAARPATDFLAQARPEDGAADLGAFELPSPRATVVTLPLPSGVTDPTRVFTRWDWGDGSPVLVTVGVTSSHLYAAGAHTLTATTDDPVTGTFTVTTRTFGGGMDGGGVVEGGVGDAGGVSSEGGAQGTGCSCTTTPVRGGLSSRALVIGAVLIAASVSRGGRRRASLRQSRPPRGSAPGHSRRRNA